MQRILIIDDEKSMRELLSHMLKRAGYRIGAAECGEKGFELFEKDAYDLVISDVSMPGLSGLALIKRLKDEKPKLRILVLSMHGESQYAARALKAGASGYLNKDSAAEQLVGAIRKIAAGGVHIGEAAAASLIATDKSPHETLSDREFEVFRLIASGRSGKEIAVELSLSFKTVSTYRTRVLQKLNLHTNYDLVNYARQEGLVE